MTDPMRIFVPYTELQRATRIALRHHDYTTVNVARTGYLAYWQARWKDGQTFINVEHDVVPWPGALEQLWECPKPWCAFGYAEPVPGYPVLGCAKFSAEAIAAAPELPAPGYIRSHKWATTAEEATSWLTMDRLIGHALLGAGVMPHRHNPPVSNLNPIYVMSEQQKQRTALRVQRDVGYLRSGVTPKPRKQKRRR